jgi:hypothetical protein
VESLDPLAHRVEVGQQPAEPALVDVEHPGFLRNGLDRVLGLLLRADEQDQAPARREILHEGAGTLQQRDRLHQVDDVDPVALAEDVAPHLRVPPARLVAEMHAGLQQLFHSHFCLHITSLFRALKSRPGELAGPERACVGQGPRSPDREVDGSEFTRVRWAALGDETAACREVDMGVGREPVKHLAHSDGRTDSEPIP